MNSCTYLIYTHSEYDDILELTLKRINKYFNCIDICICTNNASLINKYLDNYNIKNIYEYDDTLLYTSKLISVIKQITTPYVLINHDNNIYYDYVDIEVLNTIIKEMNLNRLDTVRLSSAGIYNNCIVSDNFLLSVNSGPYYLSTFPSIWRTVSILELCNKHNYVSYHNYELVGQNSAKILKNYYISRHKNDPHPDISIYYPSAHLVQMKKWCTRHHSKLINDLSKDYNIDLNIRGYLK
jgi:hypothetical protein